VFTATSDEQFEELYKSLVDTITRNGFDEKAVEEWNKIFKEENEPVWEQYINWKPGK